MQLNTMEASREIDKIRLMPPNAMAQDYYTLNSIIFFFMNSCLWAVTDRGFDTDSVFLNKLITITPAKKSVT